MDRSQLIAVALRGPCRGLLYLAAASLLTLGVLIVACSYRRTR